LRSGRIRLAGASPNRQHFRAAPVWVWRVAESHALLDGVDLGTPQRLPQQIRMGDFWLPQRGMFYAGNSEFEVLDPARHIVTSAGPGVRGVADAATT